MPDPTSPAPAPAHPWKKTARTIIAGALTVAVLLPPIVRESGLDLDSTTWAWVAGVLTALGVFTRLMALPAVQRLLALVGLDHGDVEASQVLAMVVPEAESSPARIVAGEASPIVTGSPLPQSVTVAQLAGPIGEHRRPAPAEPF